MKATLGVFRVTLIEYQIITHRTNALSVAQLQAQIRKLPGVLKQPGSVKVIKNTAQVDTFSIFIQLNGKQIAHKTALTNIEDYLVRQGLVDPQ